MFSKRTQWSLTQNKLSEKISQLTSKGKALINLTESNPTKCGFFVSRNILSSLNQISNKHYSPNSQGLERARSAVAQYYKEKSVSVQANQIFITSSTSEAYSYIFRLLLNSGDEVMMPTPSYPLINYLAKLNDVSVKTYSLGYEKRWSMDVNSIGKSFKKQKLMILINPNNPTGNYIYESELKLINQLAEKQKAALLCDEVFHDFNLREKTKTPLSLASNNKVLTFTLSGISKSLALPQMKLSWIVVSGPKRVREEAMKRLEVIADTFLSVSTPVQNALPVWLKERDKIQAGIKKRVLSNLDYLQRELVKYPENQILTVEGGWSVIIQIPKIYSEEDWVLKFLTQDQVIVHPGYFYDFPKEAYIVISLILPPKQFRQGICKIFKRIRKEQEL